MKKLLSALIATLSLAWISSHAGLIHRYDFNDGTPRDRVGSVDGRLVGPGATIAGGQLQLSNDPATPRAKVSCLEFARSILPEGHTATIAVWFTANKTGGFARVLNFGDSEGTEGKQFLYFTPSTADGDARVAITASDADAKTYLDFGALDDGKPHFVVIVVDGAAKRLRVFVDGKEPRPVQHLGDNTLDQVRPVENWLGRSSFAGDPGLVGSIDELRIYDTALTLEDVVKLHQAGPDGLPLMAIRPPNISGTWDMAVETPMGTGHPIFTFKHEGETLSGTYRGSFGEAPVTGTLKDGVATFTVQVTAGGRPATLVYTGTVTGTTMKGKVVLGAFGEGTFTGKKQRKGREVPRS